VVRHSWFVSPQDPLTLDTHEQFFLGDDLLIAPVFEPGTAEVNVYVPAGQWCDFWTGEARSTGGWTRLDAPLGFPAVLMRQGNTMLVEAREQLRDGGDIAT
jgi:alpha-glucosidase